MKLNYEKFYYYSFLIFAFSLPLSRASLSLFSVLLPLIWIIEGNFKNKISIIKKNKILFTLLLFYLWTAISIFWSENKTEAIDNILQMRYFLLPIIMATSLKNKHINQMITTFLVAMFISIIVAYGIIFDIWHYHNVPSYDACPFMVHMEYSVFLAFASVLSLERILSSRYSKNEKVLYIIFFILVTGNLFLQAGRTGQVAYLFALISIFFIHFKFNIKGTILSILILLSLFSSGYFISSSFRNILVDKTYRNIDKMVEQKNFDSSFGVRVAYGISTCNIMKNDITSLLFGEGVGDYIIATRQELDRHIEKYEALHFRIKFMRDCHPHNQFFAIQLQTGIIGLFLLFLLLYYILTKKYANQEIQYMAILFIIVYFMGSMAEPLFFKQFSLALVSFFIGIFALAKTKNS